MPVLGQHCPAVCVSDPPLQLDAGVSNISAIVDNNFGRQCQATIYFSDPLFLPITYHFENISCDGLAVTSFTVPIGVPNGIGCVVWQCAGPDLLTCNNVVISGGSPEDPAQATASGTIGCILETTQTQTTLTIVTTSSKVFTEVTSSTVTSLTTSTLGRLSSASTPAASEHGSVPPLLTGFGMMSGFSYSGQPVTSGVASFSTEISSINTGAPRSILNATSQSPAATFQSSAATFQSSAATSQRVGFTSQSTGAASGPSTTTSVIFTVTVLQTITSVLTACVKETSI
ncbi:hypothetical protein F5Y03DRAFT_400980 [Xylaria venustula]|nr:hypothetical protein F5Y03DRAFT_400980 [Xylaria venustula]